MIDYDKLTEREWLKILRKNPFLIALKEDQTEEFQMKFLSNYFKDEHESFVTFNIGMDETYTIFASLKKPSKKILTLLDNKLQSYSSIRDMIDIEGLDNDTILFALRTFPRILQNIPNPTQEMAEEAKYTHLTFLENRGITLSDKIKSARIFQYRPDETNTDIEINWSCGYHTNNSSLMFKHIETDEDMKRLIAAQPYNILSIKNPSEDLQMTAAQADISAICYIANPTHKVQEYCFNHCLSERQRKDMIESLFTDDICDIIKDYLDKNPAMKRLKGKVLDKDVFLECSKEIYDNGLINACMEKYGDEIYKKLIKRYGVEFTDDDIALKYSLHELEKNRKLLFQTIRKSSFVQPEAFMYKFNLSDDEIIELIKRKAFNTYTPILNMLTERTPEIIKLIIKTKTDVEMFKTDKYMSPECFDIILRRLDGNVFVDFYQTLFYVLTDEQKERFGKKLQRASKDTIFPKHIINYSASNAVACLKANISNAILLSDEMLKSRKVKNAIMNNLNKTENRLLQDAISELLVKKSNLNDGERLLIEVNKLC